MKNKKLLTILGVTTLLVGGMFVNQEAREVSALGGRTWSLAGDKLNNWAASDKTYTLKWDSKDERYEIVVELTANSQFKIVKDYSWNVSVGWNGYSTDKGKNEYLADAGGNFKVKTTNTYLIYMYDNDSANYGFWSGDVGIEVYNYATAEVQPLVTNYYNLGTYIRDTTINFNEKAVNEISEYFHAKATQLVRTTYFTKDALWMSRGDGEYSYYGSEGGNLTNGTATEAKVVPPTYHTAVKDTSMEKYYTTLEDIKNAVGSATWTKSGSVYSSTDATLIQYFLDFTAPCFLNHNDTNANYLRLEKVTIEESGSSLVLKLHVNSGDSGKLVGENNTVLSVATITK